MNKLLLILAFATGCASLPLVPSPSAPVRVPSVYDKCIADGDCIEAPTLHASAYTETGRWPGSPVVKTLLGGSMNLNPGGTFGVLVTAPNFTASTAPGFTFTGTGNVVGFQLQDQTKIQWLNNGYLYFQGTTFNLVSNGATIWSGERTAGTSIYTPGIGTFGRPALVIFSTATAVQNGGTCAAGVDLITYSLPLNTLVTTNNCIQVDVWGTTANNATAKNIDLSIGATPTVLVTKALTVSIAGTWTASATICRTGASTQTSMATADNNGGTTVSSVDGATVLRNTSFSTPNFTETSAQSIRVRCITNANAAGDIIAKGMMVTYQ